MKFSRIESYAKALYNLGIHLGNLEHWLSILDQMNSVFEKNSQIMNFFSSPLIVTESKKTVLKNCFKKFLPTEVMNYCLLLVERKHFNDFGAIFKSFRKKVFKDLKYIDGTLLLAYPIDDEKKQQLIKEWESTLQSKIILEEKLDPHLIGGGILKLDDDFIDFSLKGKLEKLKTELKK